MPDTLKWVIGTGEIPSFFLNLKWLGAVLVRIAPLPKSRLTNSGIISILN